ncbi:MAG: hypothetical protein K6T83_04915 [Alicyclobacillus sp.]|nr:hypothetical protein [Alicyclobacillus sp.]
MLFRFGKSQEDDLFIQYCKANHLIVVGNTAFSRKIGLIYQILSIAWFAVTGACGVWCLVAAVNWATYAFLLCFAGYMVLYFIFHLKYGVSREKIEDQLRESKWS